LLGELVGCAADGPGLAIAPAENGANDRVALGAGALTRLLSPVPRRSAFLLLTEIFAASNLGKLDALVGGRNRALIRDLCFAAGAWGAQHNKAQKQNTEANHK
jgi:hypothetical protein